MNTWHIGKLNKMFRKEFSKSTILINKILGKFKLRLCKDCQKITTSNNLRCSKCDTIHTQFRYEELRAELQYE